MEGKKYIIITPAHNEEQNIGRLLLSVVNQTLLPKIWIIVNDRSNDKTEEIIVPYADKYSFIKYLKITGKPEHSFGAKVRAIHKAIDTIELSDYDYIGILDADISFEKEYFKNIIDIFGQNEKLGIAGGKIVQFVNNEYRQHIKSPDSVAGAVQLFRRECFENTDGFIPRENGGEDTLLEITARMKGWQVKTITEQIVLHYGNVTAASFKQRFNRGYSFYTLGYHPLFHVMRCIYRIQEKPVFTGTFAEISGYVYASITSRIEVSAELRQFLRNEQSNKIKALFRSFF